MSYILATDFVRVTPEIWPGRGASFDVENVLCDYHGLEGAERVPIVRDEALAHLAELSSKSIKIALITHNEVPDFVHAVQSQVQEATQQDTPTYSGADNEPNRRKEKKGVFLEVADELNVPPYEMVHIDDQWKSHRGARKAGYAHTVWTEPWGEHQHPGVENFRIVENKLIKPIIARRSSTIIVS